MPLPIGWSTKRHKEMQKEIPKYPLDPPVVWPQRDLTEGKRDPSRPLVRAFDEPRSFFGVVHAPDEANVYALKSLAFRKPDLKCRLIISLSAACATRQSELEVLNEMTAESDGRLVFRILVLDYSNRP